MRRDDSYARILPVKWKTSSTHLNNVGINSRMGPRWINKASYLPHTIQKASSRPFDICDFLTEACNRQNRQVLPKILLISIYFGLLFSYLKKEVLDKQILLLVLLGDYLYKLLKSSRRHTVVPPFYHVFVVS